eukprot:5982085-Alexandrium_andersonii.AAC.1
MQRLRAGARCRARRRGSGAQRSARPGSRSRWASWRPCRRCSRFRSPSATSCGRFWRPGRALEVWRIGGFSAGSCPSVRGWRLRMGGSVVSRQWPATLCEHMAVESWMCCAVSYTHLTLPTICSV